MIRTVALNGARTPPTVRGGDVGAPLRAPDAGGVAVAAAKCAGDAACRAAVVKGARWAADAVAQGAIGAWIARPF